MTALISEIKRALPTLILKENEPMSAHCSFKTGGAASAFAQPKTLGELTELCALLKANGVTPLVIGNGTNLLVSDSPLDIFVIKIGEGLDSFSVSESGKILAESGLNLARLSALCAEKCLTGLEFAQGIPGSLGGGIYMNAGAYGGELKDVVRSVKYLDSELKPREKRGDDLDFGYRHSAFLGTADIIVSAELELSPGDGDTIREKMRELNAKRRLSQPLEFPSAGSAFKRPKTGYAAALIEEAGLKGFAIGAAQMSDKHAGFIVNRGGASFSDVLALIEHVQKTVFERSGVELEPEIRIIR